MTHIKFLEQASLFSRVHTGHSKTCNLQVSVTAIEMVSQVPFVHHGLEVKALSTKAAQIQLMVLAGGKQC